jgi:hypothetical protein
VAEPKVANYRLQQAMDAAGLSNKSLARAVVEASITRGRPVGTDHSRVAGWLAGATPRGDAAEALLEAFKRRTGRVYTPEELGLSTVENIAADLGLTYAKDLSQATQTVTDLARQDLAGHPDIVKGPYSSAGLYALCLDWLFSDTRDELPTGSAASVAVRADELRTMTETFDSLDRRFGGEHHRQTAVRYLHEIVAPQLTQLREGPAAREYLRQVAVLCELIGWMAYDNARHSAAQRYFSQAVRFAHAAGDEAYASYAVASMADQALFLGQPQETLRLAQVARSRTAAHLPSISLVEARVFEARAHAVMGDMGGVERALADAERTFDQLAPDAVPEWASNWSPAVLSSHAATCWADVGDTSRAARLLGELWASVQDQPRRRVYCAVQLSKVALVDRDVDQSTHFAELALESMPQTSSRRSWRVLTDQVVALQRSAGAHPQVRELRDAVRLRQAS